MRRSTATLIGVALATGLTGGLIAATASSPDSGPIVALATAEQNQIAQCMAALGQKYTPYSPVAAQIAALAGDANSITELTDRTNRKIAAIAHNPNQISKDQSQDPEQWLTHLGTCQQQIHQKTADTTADLLVTQDNLAQTRGLKRSQAFAPGTKPEKPKPGPDAHAGPRSGSVAKGNSAVNRFAINRNSVRAALGTYQQCVRRAGLPAKDRDDFNNRYTYSNGAGVPRGVGYRAVARFINRAIDVQEQCYQPVQQAYDEALQLLVD